jgi:hypothetical protein
MLDGIVNKGGSVEYFGIYDPEIMSFVKISSKEQFDKLLIPSIDSLPPKPDRKKVAEVKIAKKQIIDLIQNIS